MPNPSTRLGIGFVGGGPGSFVGRHHFLAATLDRRFAISCGVFAQSRERNFQTCDELDIPQDRRYETWKDMLDAEAARPDGVQAIGVLTPNDLHHEIVAAALSKGFHVLCDKPVTRTLQEALELHDLSRAHGRILAVSYNYSGYPMVRLARNLVRQGEVGPIRHVHGRFPSGYLAMRAELEGNKQAAWRTDPQRVGASASLMDLGTHVHHMIRFVTGLQFKAVFADLSRAYPERRVDDNAEVLFRLSDGTPGSMWVSMIAAGLNDEGPSFCVSGTAGSLEWSQKACNELRLRKAGDPMQTLLKAGPYLASDRQADSRIGFGPPDGFLEAFANIYTDFADAISSGRSDAIPETLPTIEDGVAGLRFVEAGARSAATSGWMNV